MYHVILFHSTNHAMWTMKSLKKKDITCRMINVPRHLSSDCGYCVRILSDDLEKVKTLIVETGIEYSEIHPLKEA